MSNFGIKVFKENRRNPSLVDSGYLFHQVIQLLVRQFFGELSEIFLRNESFIVSVQG